MSHKFNPEHMELLEDPGRERMLPPEILWNGFGVERPRAVVDLGAGTGFFAARFAPWLAADGVIWACDTNPLMIQWMQRHLSPSRLARIKPTLVEEGSVGLPDRSVDLVYLINTYHELENPSRMLGELARTLAPGATLAVVDWKKEPMADGPPLEHRVEAKVIRGDLKRAGLRSITELAALPFHTFVVGRKG